MEKILVVDDDVSILKVLQMRLESEQYAVVAASEIREAKERIAEGSFDIALLDLKLDGGTGIELMKSLREVDPDLPVIILTAYGTIESAVEAMKEGAYSYLTKPFDYRELLIQIRNGIEKAKLSREVKRLRSMLRADFEGQSIIGQSEAMKRVFEAVALCRGDGLQRLHQRRERDGQGTRGQGPPPAERAKGQALRPHQLRGHPRHAAGERVVRLREGGLHGRHRE